MEKGAGVNAAGALRSGRMDSEAAAAHGRIDMIELLLNNGAETIGGWVREQYVRSVSLEERMGHLLLPICSEATGPGRPRTF